MRVYAIGDPVRCPPGNLIEGEAVLYHLSAALTTGSVSKLTISPDGKYLYAISAASWAVTTSTVLNGPNTVYNGIGNIQVFAINGGSLSQIQTLPLVNFAAGAGFGTKSIDEYITSPVFSFTD